MDTESTNDEDPLYLHQYKAVNSSYGLQSSVLPHYFLPLSTMEKSSSHKESFITTLGPLTAIHPKSWYA